MIYGRSIDNPVTIVRLGTLDALVADRRVLV
jgi:hypothetical protein